MNCFQCFHFHNQGWPSLMLFDNMINVCNIGVRKLANDIYCSGMIYLSSHWKRQHFASAFNCFVGVRINIYKLAMVRKFYDNNEWIFKLELFLSLRQIWFSLHFISIILVWLSQWFCPIYHWNAHTTIQRTTHNSIIHAFTSWIDWVRQTFDFIAVLVICILCLVWGKCTRCMHATTSEWHYYLWLQKVCMRSV